MSTDNLPSMATRTYDTLVWLWPDDNQVRVVARQNGADIVRLPLRFLESSGSNTWAYILLVIRDCVNEPGRIVDGDGQEATGSPVAGQYFYDTIANEPITFSSGPESKSRFRPPSAAGSVSTMSDSKRSSINQNTFRVALYGRDFNCLLSREPFAQCTASHIVPYSRSDVYDGLGQPQFHVSSGLLLRDDLHHSYDRYEWSLYDAGDGRLIVHYFAPTRSTKAYHGIVLNPDRFRVEEDREYPNRSLLRWHYRQCVQKNIRGFWVPP